MIPLSQDVRFNTIFALAMFTLASPGGIPGWQCYRTFSFNNASLIGLPGRLGGGTMGPVEDVESAIVVTLQGVFASVGRLSVFRGRPDCSRSAIAKRCRRACRRTVCSWLVSRPGEAAGVRLARAACISKSSLAFQS